MRDCVLAAGAPTMTSSEPEANRAAQALRPCVLSSWELRLLIALLNGTGQAYPRCSEATQPLVPERGALPGLAYLFQWARRGGSPTAGICLASLGICSWHRFRLLRVSLLACSDS
jgi:hypothetical protein